MAPTKDEAAKKDAKDSAKEAAKEAAEAPKSTEKRDYLIRIEKEVQKRWEEEKLFQVDAPPLDGAESTEQQEERWKKDPKWFGTYPYSYANGSLHLGHGFTISKIEFATGFERMQGKRSLFPVGFHCTGMPIKAAADKLIREMELFGPDFERYSDAAPEPEPLTTAPTGPPPASTSDTQSATSSLTTSNVGKSAKSKVAAKSAGTKYQFQTMLSIGVKREEIKKFADPYHWLEYFPPLCKSDLTAFGARVDWRRSFITTDANPYYDSFVRWQMNKLHSLNHIKFGLRYTIYSQRDGQPCMDHDRSEGEGRGPQEYTAIKMKVVEWGERAKGVKEKVGDGEVYLVAATLRPETMYGQTNCFVGPSLSYGLYEALPPKSQANGIDGSASNKKIYYLSTERAAKNMAFQGILLQNLFEEGKASPMKSLGEVKGSELVGTKITAPSSVHKEVYVLPMESVLATKGTGVVTCVPSDSPDDYQTTQDLRKKADYYKIDPSWAALEPVPVLSTKEYGDLTAIALVKKNKVQSSKDTVALAAAKEEAYKLGFYEGIMVAGPYKGEHVQVAKPKVQKDLIDSGAAFAYSEPEGKIVSRSGEECVVALLDQWYLDYGETEWRKKADLLLSRMETYSPQIKKEFDEALDWLKQWACARSYGLGSKLPWDPQFLVESLSDSTIYMSYYTVAHLLHQGSFDGSTVGPLGIKPEQMTDEVWDYILTDKPFPSNAPISKEQGEALRSEFTYWYPLDIRSSGRDLIRNHLSFWVYVHSAIFPEKYWPRSVRANGHLMLNSEKMSKSTGNFLTLRECVEKFGADATRVALADSGDGLADANFEATTANASILRLHTLSTWCEEVIRDQDQYRSGPKDNWFDRVFEAEILAAIERTETAYKKALYRDALKVGMYDFLLARDFYRDAMSPAGGGPGMHKDLVLQYVKIQALLLTPIAPHFAEHIWGLLGEKGSIQNVRWPRDVGDADQGLLDSAEFVREFTKTVRDAEIALVISVKKSKAKKGGKGGGAGGGGVDYDEKKRKAVRVFVSRGWPEWQLETIKVMKENVVEKGAGGEKEVDLDQVRRRIKELGMIKDKRVMPFVKRMEDRIKEIGSITALDRTVLYDELSTLKEVRPYLKRTLGFDIIELRSAEDTLKGIRDEAERAKEEGMDERRVELSEPGSPGYVIWNVGEEYQEKDD